MGSKVNIRRFILILSAFNLFACASENPGVDPDRNLFYFPTGLALDPLRPIMYVTNSNADLRYNGGTVMVVDLSKFPSDLSKMREQVSSGNLICEPDRTDPTKWECSEDQFINSESTIKTGDYPGEIRIASDGSRLFSPVRGANFLLWVKLEALDSGKIDLRCNNDANNGCVLVGTKEDCFTWECDEDHQVKHAEELDEDLPAEPLGIYLNELVAVHIGADGEHRTCKDKKEPKLSCDCGDTQICNEPDSGELLSNCCIVASEDGDHVYLAHLLGGEVSFFKSSSQGVELKDIKGDFFNTTSSVKGGFSITPSLPGDPRSPIYVGSRSDSSLGSFVIQNDSRIINGARTSVAAISPGNDVRGIEFAPLGDRLFVVDRKPPTLIAIDMSDKGGFPSREILWAVEICEEPSLLRIAQDPEHKDDPTRLLAYVVCFGEAQIYVVDVFLGQVVDHIFTGKGPHTLEIDEKNQRAFIANFLDNTIGIIDLNPTHASYRTMVVRIGKIQKLGQDT